MITTKETMAMPGVKGIGNETMKVYGQLAMALVAEINANEIEEQLLGRRLTQGEVADLYAASNGIITLDGSERDLNEVRALRLKAEGHLEKGVAAEAAGE